MIGDNIEIQTIFGRFIFLKLVLRSQTFINDSGLSKFVLCQYWFHTCSETETLDSFIAKHFFQCTGAL